MSTLQVSISRKTYPAPSVVFPTTLIIACPDPRFQEAIQLFIREELGLLHGQYLLLGELGGVVQASDPACAPHERRHFEDIVSFCFLHFPTIKCVVGINHEDCARYKAFQKIIGVEFLRGLEILRHRQIQDLHLATEAITALASLDPGDLCIKEFYMRYAEEERVSVTFEAIA